MQQTWLPVKRSHKIFSLFKTVNMKKVLTKIFQIVICACCFVIFSNGALAQGQFGIYQFTGTSSGNGQFNSVTAQPGFGTFSTFTRTGCTWLTGYPNAWASE